ncbi:crotonase [Denitratisoma sp. DHT3]|uniref:enoyl-CoA hydratase-related protein n=1 Tax=Denitratisoma sp. DHT3 TaxID=1981880 RepID=UPI00119899F3|nr:enoyl-CoA hydratase-related protein [Denitratisoma sp. DHT3]QDX82621.1 crotonase [Denitratisoma sp. DHT3]
MYQDIRYEVHDHVALITLHRPEVMNAFSGRMGEEWSDAYRRADADDDVRVVVVTGAGKAFCAGADMSGGADTFGSFEGGDYSAAALSTAAFEIRKPVIAAVNGAAIGLGLSLAIQADFRVLAREGKYGLLQVRRGVVADAYIHWTLPRLIGTERANELLMTGRRIDGDEAEKLGLALRVVPAAEVLPTALALSAEIATQCSPLAVSMTKHLLCRAATLTLPEVERLETRWLKQSMGREDAIEGGVAYLEKRLPQWRSRVGRDWPVGLDNET